MPDHTPLPWTVESGAVKPTRSSSRTREFIIRGAMSTLTGGRPAVATVGNMAHDYKREEADARLIVEAVNGYAALQERLEAAEALLEERRFARGFLTADESAELQERTKAAEARAEAAERLNGELVTALRVTNTRFGILASRMHARDEHDGRVGDNDSGYSHELSRFEISGWLEAESSPKDGDSCGICTHDIDAHYTTGETDIDGRPVGGPFEVCGDCLAMLDTAADKGPHEFASSPKDEAVQDVD